MEFAKFIMECIKFILGDSSVAMSILAIFLSVYFFVQAKKSEKNSEVSLAKIEAQTDTLQKISSRFMDRLTKYATTSHPSTESLIKLIESTTQQKNVLEGQLAPQTLEAGAETANLRAELITCYIGLYYYCSLTNYYSQWFLPKFSEFDPSKPTAQLDQRVVDLSFRDINFMRNLLSAINPQEIQASPLFGLYDEAEKFWYPSAKNSTDTFKDRE